MKVNSELLYQVADFYNLQETGKKLEINYYVDGWCEFTLPKDTSNLGYLLEAVKKNKIRIKQLGDVDKFSQLKDNGIRPIVEDAKIDEIPYPYNNCVYDIKELVNDPSEYLYTIYDSERFYAEIKIATPKIVLGDNFLCMSSYEYNDFDNHIIIAKRKKEEVK